MRTSNLFIILVLIIATLVSAQTDSTKAKFGAKTATIKVIVTKLESNDGKVFCALCNSKENYEQKGNAFKGIKSNISKSKSEIVFSEIPYGTYAFKLFHDEDNDGVMSTNWLGIPSEDYAFSNNAKGSMGPAKWNDAKFEVNTDEVIQTIIID